MSAKTIIAAIAFGLIAGGCAPMRTGAAVNCKDGGACKIVVTVVDDCRISVDPPVLDVYGPHVIQWDIAGNVSSYTFADDGIAFKEDTKQEFFGRSPGPSKFIWIDRNAIARSAPYGYTVKVMKGSTACKPLDPGIINHG